MQSYKKNIQQILNKSQQSYNAFNNILQALENSHEVISASESSKPSKAYILELLHQQFSTPNQSFFIFYHKLLTLLYTKKSRMIPILYEAIPHLLISSIIIQHKKQGLDESLVTMYNNELTQYNAVGDRRLDMINSSNMQKIYHEHMSKQLGAQQWLRLNQIDEITVHNRSSVKALLLWLWYSKIGTVGDNSILGYFNLIYIYFGGSEKQINKGVSLYLLEKRSVLNFFKYSITEQEMGWIILALYDLALQRQNFKYQLLAAINIVHKKAANQCQFKLSQIAQSVIHLLQDQYSNVF